MNVGIDDGAEFAYWQEYLHELWGTWENVNETAVKYLKDPDVDKDNVTDGKEINGWTVKIIVGYDEQNNPISKDVTLYGDPLAAYKDPEGNYIDSDEDNIPDIVESLLSNNSTFAKFARLFADPTSEYYDLWTSYNWTIAYFFSMRNNRNFHYYLDLLDANKYSAEQIARYITEWNNTAPHNKSCAENATQWLRDEFNPLITESMAPVITEFHVMTVYRGEVFPGVPNAKAKIVLEIRDVAGISDVRIRSICPDIAGIMIWTIDMDFNGETTVIIGKDEPFYIDVTEYSAVLTYNISVNATDTLGNSAEWYKEVDGPFGAFIKTVANMLRAFWEFLCEVGAKIAEAVNFIVEWIIEQVKNIILAPINALFSTIQGWRENVINAVKMYVSEYINNNGQVSESTVEYARRVLDLTWFFFIVLGVVIALNTAIMFVEGVTFGAAAIIFHVVIPLIVIVMVETFMHTQEYETKSIGMPTSVSFNYLLNMVKNYILGGSKRETRDATAVWDIIFNALASLAGLVGWIFLLISLDEAGMGDITGSVYATAGVATGLLSWLVFGVAATSFAPIQPWGDVFGILAMTFGAASMYFGWKATRGFPVPKIIGILGMVFGVISIALGWEGLSFV